MARLIPTRAPGEADDEYRARLVAHRDHQRRELRRALWLIAQGAAACALIWWFTSQMCAQGRDIALYGPPGVSRVAPESLPTGRRHTAALGRFSGMLAQCHTRRHDYSTIRRASF